MAIDSPAAPAREDGPAPEASATALGEKIAALLARFDTTTGPRQARDDADELARTIVRFYGDAIERMLGIVYDSAGEQGDDIMERLCEDRFVESLLVLHGLHPIPTDERVMRALEGVRPYLQSHDGDVELLGIDDDVVHVRLIGSCDGCQSSAATLKFAVEKAIFEKMPEIREVRAGEPTTEKKTATLTIASDWLEAGDLADGAVRALEITGFPVLLARSGGTAYAYRNRCPACATEFARPHVAGGLIACSGCSGGYELRKAGRSKDGKIGAVPLPLEERDGRVRITIPVDV